MPTFRADSKDSGQKDDDGRAIFVPVTALLANEVRVSCPGCGSPYIASFGVLEPRSKGMGTFACTAGDCRYQGPVTR